MTGETSLPARGFSSQALARAIYKAEVSADFVQSLPVQSLFLAMKQLGVSSSCDLLNMTTVEQFRLLLDFDLWHKDSFSEEQFWEWLALGDEDLGESDAGFRILLKTFRSMDLRLVGLLITRYVDVQTFTEPTENPPAGGYYTPDKGHTWLQIRLEEQRKHFLLARFLAIIFETNADIFYQLLASPGVSTESTLEEDAFQDREKRLAAEGIPDQEFAHRLHAAFTEAEALSHFHSKGTREKVIDIQPIEPLIYERQMTEPLSSLIKSVKDREQFESELSLILNASVVRWAVDFSNYQEVIQLTAKVKGAINIGLEALMVKEKVSSLELYEHLGLQKFYRLGLTKILAMRKAVLSKKLKEEELMHAPERQALWQGISLPFPEIPEFFLQPGEHELKAGFRAITTLKELTAIESFFQA